MKHSFWAFSALWAFTLVVSRIYIYHDAYNKGIQQLEHDKWLLERCQARFIRSMHICICCYELTWYCEQDPEFYANISRSSPDLCAEVEVFDIECIFIVPLSDPDTAKNRPIPAQASI